MFEVFLGRYPFFFVVLLMTIGLYGMLAKENLLKRVIGLNIFQTAIYVFFIQGANKTGATVPVIDPALGAEAAAYMNPLPQALIITAIVVGIAVTGLAMAFLITISRTYNSLYEHKILKEMSK